MDTLFGSSLDPVLLREGDPHAMRIGLDQLSLPVLLVERCADGTDFRICASNAAFEGLAGYAPGTLAGTLIGDMLPDDQAVQALYRMRKCLGTGNVLTCPELISLPTGDFVREATFIPAETVSDMPRLLWAGVALNRIERQSFDRRAYEDLRFYSVDAARQVAQVTTALEAIAESAPTYQRLQPAAQTLAAICRSAEQSLRRISDRSEGLLGMAEAPATYLTDARKTRDQEGYLSAMRDVVQDLIVLVAPNADHVKHRANGARLP